MRASQRQAEGERGPSPARQPPAFTFLALCADWVQPPLRQLPSVAKASGNVPTFRKLTHNPAMREKERDREIGQVGAECRGERKCIRYCCDGSVPQNASALPPSLSSLSPLLLPQVWVRALPKAQGSLGRPVRLPASCPLHPC